MNGKTGKIKIYAGYGTTYQGIQISINAVIPQ